MAMLRRFDQAWFIALGGGLYWAASMLFLTAWRPQLETASESGMFSTTMLWFLISAVISIALAFHKLLMRRRFQIGLAAICLVATAAYIATTFVNLPGNIGTALSLVINACHHGFLIVFWGLVYTSLSKHDAERAVILSALVAFAAYFACLLLPIGNFGAALAAVLRAAGIVPFLVGFVPLPTLERSASPDSLSLLVPFYLNRAFLGFCMAPLFFLSSSIAHDSKVTPSLPLSIAGLAVCSIALAVLLQHKKSGVALLRVAPLAFLGAVLLPYALPLESLGNALLFVASSIVWLSWITLSATQLSDIKERVGLDEAFLAISEKVVVLTAIFLGFALCALASTSLGTESLNGAATPLAAILMYVGVMVCCYLFTTLIDKKQQQRIIKKAIMTSDGQQRMLHAAIAKKYRLTDREKDVFSLMAAGHTRPHIREQLCISDGTAKTHAYHIYEKLGVHSREELYALVESARKKMADNAGEENLL